MSRVEWTRRTHPVRFDGHTLLVLALDRKAKEPDSEVECRMQHAIPTDVVKNGRADK